MYLISVYFDEATEKRLQKIIEKIEAATGNDFYSRNNVPPHMTVTAVETRCEEELLKKVKEVASSVSEIPVFFATVGAFLPQVLYVQPVLNEEMHTLSENLWDEVSNMEETIPSKYYMPFGWIPHCTMAKQLDQEQMRIAFSILQQEFAPFEGKITRIGIAKTNPHRDLETWSLVTKR